MSDCESQTQIEIPVPIPVIFMRIKDKLIVNSNNEGIIELSQNIPMMDMSHDYTFISQDQIKMEPMSPPVRSRKRNASQTSWGSSASITSTSAEKKKLKKYQLDPTTDPSVKNALAAKINRDKKKQEELKLKTENDDLKARNMQLEQKLQDSLAVQAQLRLELEQERAKSRRCDEQDHVQNAGTFFSYIGNDLNSKYALEENPVNDDFSNIDVDSSFTNFDFNEYLESDLRLFGSPGTEEKITGIEDSPNSVETSCQSAESEYQLSEISDCLLDPVLTVPMHMGGNINAGQRNLMGEFNNIMQYLSE